MNYLAHIYLSEGKRQLQVGNFIGDFVKGRKHEEYPKEIQMGILLHREIDKFTDCHPIFLETTELLRPTFGRYSGIIADMYFDYLLASDFKRYNKSRSLTLFAANFYLSAIIYYKWLPDRVKGFIFHFIWTNRLKQYSTYEGLEYSLRIMSHYKSSAINPELSISFLKDNEEVLRSRFNLFMPQAIDYVRSLAFE
ncbi:MAG: ACP phosphodiesterase [Bacteroidetes bacterium 41-46]|nr:MAG: ACP phosphodiesterase [Bacteroidetes bacterium 41-46]